MSNSDGFIPNHLLQQVYGTTVLDEDVDLDLNDKELELIAGDLATSCGTPYCSDVFYNGKLIIDYKEFKKSIQTDKTDDDWNEINYFKEQFRKKAGITIDTAVATELWQQLRALGSVEIKRARKGFKYNPNWKPGDRTRIIDYVQ